ncbi:MAG: DoxX family protein [Verrucomicrobia bacterium]|nr:DoxX family protein [Verrucomicrobiota bacterium]MDA1069241.1 DoxX family protein [Verrucomicrobiota bacterium]
MKLPNLIYWFSTTLLSILLLTNVYSYLFNHGDTEIAFELLGYPAYLIYPLAFAKICAVIAIVSSKVRFLKSLAYAGVFYNFGLALIAHVANSDGAGFLSFLGLVLLTVSFVFDKIMKPSNKFAYNL